MWNDEVDLTGMIISPEEFPLPTAQSVQTTDDTLTVELSDGRSISVPLAWFPRLSHASQTARNNWRLIGQGHGIHWKDLDEDISVENLLAGRPSGESQASFKKWLALHSARPAKRKARRKPTGKG